MNSYTKLRVFYNNILVGILVKNSNNLIAFEYDKNWISNGFSISPITLPLEPKVFIQKIEPFNGLFGVFNDTLPDGWGRLLVDRMLLKEKINPLEFDNLNRLAIISDLGLGALSYKPNHEFNEKQNEDEKVYNLDNLSKECKNILITNDSKDLDKLFLLGSSSGGARPKILTKFNNEDWIIKFPSSNDNKNIGEAEYNYSLCAKNCGIEMPETNLFNSKICSGYFGVKRFDRENSKKIHMISVSGLLETSHRIPNLDYNILMKLTLKLTKNYKELEKLYRQMCFNVFAHNKDDHSKNFSFLFNNEKKSWHLSPAYDLTYSFSINGEHATTINGEGKNPKEEDILEIAKNFAIDKTLAKDIMHEIKRKTKVLKKYQI